MLDEDITVMFQREGPGEIGTGRLGGVVFIYYVYPDALECKTNKIEPCGKKSWREAEMGNPVTGTRDHKCGAEPRG
jgi:hypothetical protein